MKVVRILTAEDDGVVVSVRFPSDSSGQREEEALPERPCRLD